MTRLYLTSCVVRNTALPSILRGKCLSGLERVGTDRAFSVVYVWGYNGYCRLGLGNQQDVLIPKPVPQVPASLIALRLYHIDITSQFAGPSEMSMGAQIIAGPSNTVVIDKQRMYWMAGKVRPSVSF